MIMERRKPTKESGILSLGKLYEGVRFGGGLQSGAVAGMKKEKGVL